MDLSVVVQTYDVSENADLARGLVYRGPDIRGGMDGGAETHIANIFGLPLQANEIIYVDHRHLDWL